MSAVLRDAQPDDIFALLAVLIKMNGGSIAIPRLEFERLNGNETLSSYVTDTGTLILELK